jgi:alpha-beta hydrolase superfamily lysophospholipase
MIYKKITSLFVLCSLIICSYINATEPQNRQDAATKKSNYNKLWYKDLFFKDPSFNFEAIRMLGTAYGQGTDIGECISTLKKIKNKDYQSWYNEWMKTADRVNSYAKQFEKKGDIVSARKAYFRASSYYQIAGFYLHAPSTRKTSINSWKKGRDCFIKAIASLPNITPIKIPYKNTSLPGYFIKSPVAKGKAPLLIVNTGFDGTKEELYFSVGKAAAERGYHCLMFDGPGQGEMIRLQNLPFRCDWEKVVAPAIDFAFRLPEVDTSKIALMGRSMGGYLAPRAAAFDKRLKACIANGGVYSMTESLFKKFSPDLIKSIKSNPDKFNSTMKKYSQYSNELNWFIINGMWTFHANTPAGFFEKLKKYNMKGIAEKITCSMLVIDSEDDLFFKDQPQQLYNLLKCPKTLLVFTEDEDAELHCQMGAFAISSEKIFSWLNETFNYYPAKR